MAEHNEDFREIEELLKKQGSAKVPEGLLSGFTSEVMTRIQNPRTAPFVPGIWVLAAALVVFGVLSSVAVWMVARPSSPQRPQEAALVMPAVVPAKPAVDIPSVPVTAQSTVVPKTSTAPQKTAAVKPRQELTLDEEMRLLEEITGDSSFLEGVLDDEELIRHELGGMPAAVRR